MLPLHYECHTTSAGGDHSSTTREPQCDLFGVERRSKSADTLHLARIELATFSV